MRFLLNTKGEFLKTKRTAALWLTLFAAVFIPAINVAICVERPDVMVAKFIQTPWITFMKMNWKNVSTVILPLYTILITSLIIQIEFRNNTWKQVYTLPRKFADVFFSKLIVVHTFLLGFIVLFNVAIFLSGLITHELNSDYRLLVDSVPLMTMLAFSYRIYIGLLAITAVQYWLSLRFRNFIVPLGVGIGLWIIGIVLMDWDKIIYYPYAYPIFMFFTDFNLYPETLVQLTVCSVCSFIILLTASYLDIATKRERG
jgi:hypothetical protein